MMWSGNGSSYWHYQWLLELAEIKQTHNAWLARRYRRGRRAWPWLAWVQRAVNGVRLRYARRSAPRWRRGRWRMTG